MKNRNNNTTSSISSSRDSNTINKKNNLSATTSSLNNNGKNASNNSSYLHNKVLKLDTKLQHAETIQLESYIKERSKFLDVEIEKMRWVS